MQTLRFQLASDEPPTALASDTAACIGAFDGLHRGHQALLVRARALAPRLAVVTFDPHPARVLAPDRTPALLQTPDQRERVCAALGVDDLVLLPFDEGVAALEPMAFLDRFLGRGLRPRAVVVGDDFRFGHDRAGSAEDLRDWCGRAGIRCETVGEVSSREGDRISSTAIRGLVHDGRVGEAAEMLGRWYAVEGTVRSGAARGRKLGFPTANVAPENLLLPRAGVYACVMMVVDPTSDLHGRRWASVGNIGVNPTFEDGAKTTTGLEVHALDVDLGTALYGVRVEIGFVERLRDELAFHGPQELADAIAADIERARPMLDSSALARLPAPTSPQATEAGA